MLCEMHRGILAKLVPAPSSLLVAAKNVLTSPGDAGEAAIWAETLTAYTQSFSDSRQHVLAAARLQGALDLGREAAGAIDDLVRVAPVYLAAATAPEARGDALLASANRLGDAAMTLEVAVRQLLDLVERAVARAGESDDPGPIDLDAMESAVRAKESS